jgi:hypothetical protein
VRYEAAPYDHGFKQAGARSFEDLDEALIYAAEHRSENGRVTIAGRNQRDVRWLVLDTETGEYHEPGPEHVEAARLLAS